MIDENLLIKEEEYDLLRNRAVTLINTLNDTKFYYSIPIKSDRGNLIINPEISGEKGGFSTNIYSDKLKINRTPEAPRLIMKMNEYLDLNESVEIKSEPKQKPDEKKTEPIEQKPPKLEISKDLQTRINYFGELSNNIINVLSDTSLDPNYQNILKETLQNANLDADDNVAKQLGDILINSGIDIGFDEFSNLSYPNSDMFNQDSIIDLIEKINDILCS